MRAEQIVNSLLVASPGMTALVGSGAAAKIYPGEAPENTLPPYVVYQSEGGTEVAPIAATIGTALVTIKIRVSGVETTYAGLKALMEQVRAACAYKYGTIAGVSVVSVYRSEIGPDAVDSALGFWWQYHDFEVSFYE